VDARKILGLYMMVLMGLVLFYHQSDKVLLTENNSSIRGPAGARSVLHSGITSICSEWTTHGTHKFRRCERSFEASNWGHYEVLNPQDENYPQNGLQLGDKKHAVIEYWLNPSEIAGRQLSSVSIHFAQNNESKCIAENSNGNIQLVTLPQSIGALRWTELSKSHSRFSLPVNQSGWKLESAALKSLEREALDQLLRQQDGRLLFYLSPKSQETCVAEFKRATLNIRYLEVM
jgi:hypothetical protein